jgi:hypothetical protein
MHAFRKRDYEKAMAVFEALSETAENSTLSRRALYALASTRLILAHTPDEFSEALGLWDCLSQQVLTEIDGEDPRMVTPFLERLAPPSIPDAGFTKVNKSERSSAGGNLIVFKNLLQAKDKELERMKARLDGREKEVKRLKTQIESLEAIHRKFQERKQEVSSP